MKITSITRTISGNAYDNISMTAILEDNEDHIEAAKKLDYELNAALKAIGNQKEQRLRAESEKRDTISFLQRALEYAENNEIPF